MSTSTKTYTPVSAIQNVAIGKCTEMLPNHLQCWKAGDFVITVTTPPAEGQTEPTTTSYQKCRYHAQLEKAADDAAVAEVAQEATDEAALAAAQDAVAKDKAAAK